MTRMIWKKNILMDTMVALGLQQHTNLITHCSGNTLDLIFTEIRMSQKLLNSAVNITLSVPKTNIIRMTMPMCNLKDINLDQFTKDLGTEEIPTNNLEDMVKVFNKKTNICTRPPSPPKKPKE